LWLLWFVVCHIVVFFFKICFGGLIAGGKVKGDGFVDVPVCRFES